MLTLLGLLSLSVTPAYAWGHRADLRSAIQNGRGAGSGFLVFSALDKRALRYCLNIDPTVASDFDPNSISIQIRASLQAWLNPAQEKSYVGNVKIDQVTCLDPALDLRVVIGPSTGGGAGRAAGAVQVLMERAGHKYSEIRINSDYRSKSGPRITDFKSLLKLPGEQDLIRMLDHFISIQGFSIAVLNKESGVPVPDIYWSTYRILLHEIGHSFGLCDTAETSVHENCDPAYLTADYTDSVMSDSAFLMLTTDDEEGIARLFERFPKSPRFPIRAEQGPRYQW